MINKILKSIAILAMLLLSALAVSAATVPVTIDSVSIDGDVILPDATNRLSIERGEDIDVKVIITATADTDNVEISAFLSGYEKGKLSDSTKVFDVEANTIYKKTLKLELSERLDQDNYKLRILISDRDDETLEQNYNLKIDTARHSMNIKDVIFSPENEVKAGRALLTTVKLKNMGEKDEDDVKVTVSIPELSVSASDYLDEIEADDTKTSEEIYIRMPNCAATGEYTVTVKVTYDDEDESVSEDYTINVVADEDICAGTGKTVLTIGPESQEVEKKQSAIYALTITNEGALARTYTITVNGLDDWATAEISPSNAIVVDAKKTEAAYVYVTIDKSASAGDHMFSVTVASSGETLQQIPLTATVAGKDAGSVKKVLEISLIVLVVLLVVLGLIIGLKKTKSEEEPEEPGQTYY